jgi:hypothetical protein
LDAPYFVVCGIWHICSGPSGLGMFHLKLRPVSVIRFAILPRLPEHLDSVIFGCFWVQYLAGFTKKHSDSAIRSGREKNGADGRTDEELIHEVGRVEIRSLTNRECM